MASTLIGMGSYIAVGVVLGSAGIGINTWQYWAVLILVGVVDLNTYISAR